MEVIYIDSVFLLNLIINYLLLLVAAKIAGVGARRLRVLCGGLVGALYAVAVWLPGLGWLSSLFAKAGAAVLMVAAAYAGYVRKRFGRLILIFVAVSFALGGGVLAIELLVYGETLHGGIPALPIDFKTLLLTATISYALLAFVFRRAARYGPKDMLRVRVRYQGRETELTALMDSGHNLHDPVSGAPVLIVDAEAAQRILGVSLPERLARDPVGAMSEEIAKTIRFRLIPYRTVGAEGFLLAFQPETVWLAKQKQDKMLIALSPHPVSDGAAYHALAGGLG